MSRRDPTEFLDTFGTVRRRISAIGAQAYASIDLGPMQAKLLRRINGQISQAELARITDSDPALAGRVINALIERGLVTRERSKADRREYILELTAAGRRTRDKIDKLRSELAARVVGALDQRDLEDFERIATKILDAVS
jgi:DNA-binding MarR family transcriptional regulator